MYVIRTHLGLGDNIVQAALAVKMSIDLQSEIAFPCYEHYAPSVTSFFIHHPQIMVYTIPFIKGHSHGACSDALYDEAEKKACIRGSPQIRLGVYAGKGIPNMWWKCFYDEAGYPYSVRWDYCPIKKAAESVPQLAPMFPDPSRKIFIHDDPSRNLIIHRVVDRQRAFVVPPRFEHSILEYKDYLMVADEIHVLESCFYWIVNALELEREGLYVHAYLRWQYGDYRYESKQNWRYMF
jgi:GNAT superfamily N-acetyltransferase